MARATALSDSYRFPSYSKPSSSTFTSTARTPSGTPSSSSRLVSLEAQHAPFHPAATPVPTSPRRQPAHDAPRIPTPAETQQSPHKQNVPGAARSGDDPPASATGPPTALAFR